MHKRLLVVDDEKDVAIVLKKGLEKHGFIVDVYIDSVRALIDYRPSLYDLLLLDFKMPGLDGYELYERIRKIDRNAKVCFLSAAESSYLKEYKSRMPPLDKKHFVKKPIAIKDLVNHINLILEETFDAATS